jgi:hypothetical protein
MQLSGHQTRSVFERYNITSLTDLLNAAKRLNRDSFVTVGRKAEHGERQNVVNS